METTQKAGQGPAHAVVVFQTGKEFAPKAAHSLAVGADSHVHGAVVSESAQHSSDSILDHGNVGSVNAHGVSTDPVLKSPQSKSIMSKAIADAFAKDQGVEVESFFLANLFRDSDPQSISGGNLAVVLHLEPPELPSNAGPNKHSSEPSSFEVKKKSKEKKPKKSSTNIVSGVVEGVDKISKHPKPPRPLHSKQRKQHL
ncbi:hypothetical protein QJS04_geneDACA017989 [Acorus gramineus]|uniref:Uncharacterized protein n=1 Tax=Acorus gramineus TaxID=55184 RepID=A0AAV9A569_ACOGR|nr:hypothetical protein QJS04_geneDACA017989 [Acorus gramineus]